MLENSQFIIVIAFMLLATYQLFDAGNNWYYAYFLEKINLKRTDKFDNQGFKRSANRFFILSAAACLVAFVPVLWSLNLIVMAFIIRQIYAINYLSVKVKQLYGLQ